MTTGSLASRIRAKWWQRLLVGFAIVLVPSCGGEMRAVEAAPSAPEETLAVLDSLYSSIEATAALSGYALRDQYERGCATDSGELLQPQVAARVIHNVDVGIAQLVEKMNSDAWTTRESDGGGASLERPTPRGTAVLGLTVMNREETIMAISLERTDCIWRKE